jgi:hypothetical protein
VVIRSRKLQNRQYKTKDNKGVIRSRKLQNRQYKTKDNKGVIRSRKLQNRQYKTKEQIMIYKTLHMITMTLVTKKIHDSFIEIHSIVSYVIKFVSNLRQVRSFLRKPRFPSPIKLTAKIKLKYC